MRDSSGFTVSYNDIKDTEISAIAVLGGGSSSADQWAENGIVKYNRGRNIAIEVHANLGFAYTGVNDVLFMGNDFRGTGYFTFQDASNLCFISNIFENTNGSDNASANRCFVDQNRSSQPIPDPNGVIIYAQNWFKSNSGAFDNSGIVQIADGDGANITNHFINNLAGSLTWLTQTPSVVGIHENNVYVNGSNRIASTDVDAGGAAAVFVDAANDNFNSVPDSAVGLDAHDISALIANLKTKPYLSDVTFTDIEGNELDYTGDTFIGPRNPGFDFTPPEAPPYVAVPPVVFDVDDYLSTDGISGVADGEVFNFSAHINADASVGTTVTLLIFGRLQIQRIGPNIRVRMDNGAPFDSVLTTGDLFTPDVEHHIHVAVVTTAGSERLDITIDGETQSFGSAITAPGIMDLTRSVNRI